MQPAVDCETSATETQRLETKFAAAPFQGYESMYRKRINQRPGAQGGGKGAFKRPRFVAPRPLNAAVPAKTNKASVEENLRSIQPLEEKRKEEMSAILNQNL